MSIIDRKTDWEQRLYQFIDGRQRQGFVWGKQDCCLFAADAVLEMTGLDFAKNYRGKYHDAKGAARMGNIETLVDKAGLQRMRNVNLAMQGDILLVRTGVRDDKRRSLGVCVGLKIAAPAKEGIALVDFNRASVGWRV